jgi:hypothetical protein
MPKFYFTYGPDKHFPYQDGWTEVDAPDITTAHNLFRAIHPSKEQTSMNCAFIYTEDEWSRISMSIKGNFGKFCHEKISYTVQNEDTDAVPKPSTDQQSGKPGNNIKLLYDNITHKPILCPRCKKQLELVRATDWDNLETYFYPKCNHCNFSTRHTFETEAMVVAFMTLSC